jgi:hypothetical protein
LETCQNELNDERRVKTEHLVSTAPSSTPSEHVSPSIIEDYQTQLDQLQQNLSAKDDERTLLRERLDDVELELRKTLDNHASLIIKNELLVEERDAVLEQQALRLTDR